MSQTEEAIANFVDRIGESQAEITRLIEGIDAYILCYMGQSQSLLRERGAWTDYIAQEYEKALEALRAFRALNGNAALAKAKCLADIKAADDDETIDADPKHQWADEALCDFLKALGYGDVVEAWERIEKWYA